MTAGKKQDGITAYCGDTFINGPNEECDKGLTPTPNCPYGDPRACSVCTTQCKSVPGIISYCGDNKVDGANDETCERDSQCNGQESCSRCECGYFGNIAIRHGQGLVAATGSTLGKRDFSYHHLSGVSLFLAGSSSQGGIIDLGPLTGNLQDVSVPLSGYDKSQGIHAVVGNVYAVKGTNDYPGFFVVFRVLSGLFVVDLEYIYVRRP